MDKVLTQFNDLALQGKINKAKKVKVAKVDNFKSELFSKIIKYNRNMNKLTNDEINFCLLHEEGHYVNAIKKRHWAYLTIIIMLYLAIGIIVQIFLNKYFQNNFLSGIVATFLTLFLILIPFIRIWLSRIYQNYEYKADDYACENVDNPHEILSIFDNLESHNAIKKNIFIIKLLRILGSDLAHPTTEDRIDRIKKFADNDIFVPE